MYKWWKVRCVAHREKRLRSHLLGTPDTSLRGRKTRTARSVRRSKLLVVGLLPLANIVINLATTTKPVFKTLKQDNSLQKLMSLTVSVFSMSPVGHLLSKVLLFVLPSLWVCRAGSASGWCALRKRHINVRIQYNIIDLHRNLVNPTGWETLSAFNPGTWVLHMSTM